MRQWTGSERWNEECKVIVEKKAEVRKQWLRTAMQEHKAEYDKMRKQSNKVVKLTKQN